MVLAGVQGIVQTFLFVDPCPQTEKLVMIPSFFRLCWHLGTAKQFSPPALGSVGKSQDAPVCGRGSSRALKQLPFWFHAESDRPKAAAVV
jgi:hypothetical protein